MYLQNITIKNFRKHTELEVQFHDGLNIIVGENNSGKTTIIDALRALLTTSDDGPLRLYNSDINIENSNSDIEFTYIFKNLSIDEEASFIEALVLNVEKEFEAHFKIIYETIENTNRLRPRRFCGNSFNTPFPGHFFELLRSVYLPPLRDPMQGLTPGRQSLLGRLIDLLSPEREKNKIIEIATTFDNALQEQIPIQDAKDQINNSIKQLVKSTLAQEVSLRITTLEFRNIVNRIGLIVNKLEVEQNGLGFNNILYVAAVISELQHSDDTLYRGLLIEEPEAHLHPQLQNVLLEYLIENAKSQTDSIEERKAVQTIVSSHSPTFACQAPIDSIIAVYSKDNIVKTAKVGASELSETHRKKLTRYLTTTRAELFFARKVIFVEGMAEAILIPTISKYICNKELKDFGISVINVEGLNFNCFLPLFTKDQLNIPVSILTDSDPEPKKTKFPLKDEVVPKPTFIEKFEKQLEGASSNFYLSKKTFEYDLALESEINIALMLEAVSKLHPTRAKAIKKLVEAQQDVNQKAKTLFVNIFMRPRGKKNVSKGEFAQELALLIEQKNDPDIFNVPEYIQSAIEHVCNS